MIQYVLNTLDCQLYSSLNPRLSDRNFHESLVKPPNQPNANEYHSNPQQAGFWTEWWEAGPQPRDVFRNFVKIYMLELLSKQSLP